MTRKDDALFFGKPGRWTTVTFPNAGKMLTVPIRVEQPNPRMKCRTCEKEATRYMPNSGEHYCMEHAPLDESQVPSGAGWDNFEKMSP